MLADGGRVITIGSCVTARELGPRGITEPGRRAVRGGPARPDGVRPLRPPSEVAAAVAYLASPDAEYVTAAVLSVDGGHAA